MGKKGWWSQLGAADYSETKTNFGQDMRALEGEKLTKIPEKHERTSLEQTCCECGKLYWYDKGCPCEGKSKPKAESKIKYVVECKSCGHKQKFTLEELNFLSSFFNTGKRGIRREIMDRLKCSKCKTSNWSIGKERKV